jgi:hypothetical protein
VWVSRWIRAVCFRGDSVAPPSVSFPAKAGNPVRRGVSIQSRLSQRTGSPGQAGR